MAAVDLSQQAFAAQQEGYAEVLRLLAQPQDLARLPGLVQEYESKARAGKAALSNLVQSQVEATRQGLDHVDRAHRHVAKLRSCLDKIHALCEECAQLLDRRDAIRALSTAYGNLGKVLGETRDIIDLPDLADRALGLLEDPSAIVPAYQALSVLERTAENAKAAWKRNPKAAAHDMRSLMQHLEHVGEAVACFEALLWEQLVAYEELAQSNPSLLVDCLRIVEMQEEVDKQCGRAKLDGFKAKKYRDRLMGLMAQGIQDKFTTMEAAAQMCGLPNRVVKYTQDGDVVLEATFDYLGTLERLVLGARVGATQPSKVLESTNPADVAVLAKVKIVDEEVFNEDALLEAIVPDLYAVEADLADAYDYVSPCFPPSYNIFDTLFQTYHVHVAIVVDSLGQRAQHLSTRGALRVMEFVKKYMDTLRGLGIEDALLRLPVSPLTNPDLPPGLDMLMASYIERMEKTVAEWYTNIMVVDLQYEPTPGPNGKLRTHGVTDFFRILNEEMEVIRGIDDHGEVMFNTAATALKIMQGFQAEQTRVISDPETLLSFELFCALLNNNVECYELSLAFVEEVQEQLEEGYRDKLEVEEVCRGFLEVAKAAAKRVVGVMFNDPGMGAQLKSLYSTQAWLSGSTTGVLLATLQDYMGDVEALVEAGFVKRVAEAAADELVRRAANMFVLGIPQITDVSLARMAADEGAIRAYFSQHIKPERLTKPMAQLGALRQLLCAPSVAEVVAAYSELVTLSPTSYTPDVLQRIMELRGTLAAAVAVGLEQGGKEGGGVLDKKQVKEVLAQAKEVSKQATGEKDKKESKGGFFSFFS